MPNIEYFPCRGRDGEKQNAEIEACAGEKMEMMMWKGGIAGQTRLESRPVRRTRGRGIE